MFCATGQFCHIPLHAAGTKCEGSWDYLVPSYIPTLKTLLSARGKYTPVRRSDFQAIIAAVPRPFKWSTLKDTVIEARTLKSILPITAINSIPPEPSLVAGSSGSALAADVLKALPQATILHLACHGYHDPIDPLGSGFVMQDKMLTLTQLMDLNLPHAFLAFLSACETARMIEDQPDQAVHLAAAMLFAGFKSVIGTMWCVPIVSSCGYWHHLTPLSQVHGRCRWPSRSKASIRRIIQ